MKKFALLTAALVAPMLVMGQQADGGKDKDATIRAICILKPMSKSNVKGTIWFVQTGHKVMIKGEVTGLKEGKHGFHIHEFGDLTDAKGMSTGGHFNPTNKKHGKPSDEERHVGDLGNIVADKDGKAKINMTDTVISLHGKHSIVGRAVVIHEDEDDFGQPVGHAGNRLAAGVVGLAK
ncbi:MAG TPA: superoxide dismutase family protein [Gemmataceae bacterium]|nr:superoxide dismutase family protein [Gemmataceae bacterium]